MNTSVYIGRSVRATQPIKGKAYMNGQTIEDVVPGGAVGTIVRSISMKGVIFVGVTFHEYEVLLDWESYRELVEEIVN